MGRKRKRPQSLDIEADTKHKRLRNEDIEAFPIGHVNNPTLNLYYQKTWTLRKFLLEHLPRNARRHHRRILALQTPVCRLGEQLTASQPQLTWSTYRPDQGSESQILLSRFLDETIVGSNVLDFAPSTQSYQKEYEVFSQQLSPTARRTAPSTLSQGNVTQTEVGPETLPCRNLLPHRLSESCRFD